MNGIVNWKVGAIKRPTPHILTVVPYSGIWKIEGIFAKFTSLIKKPAVAKAFDARKKMSY